MLSFLVRWCLDHGQHTRLCPVLRFLNQSGVVVIPKSTHKERMQEYFNVSDFTLNEADMQKIQALDEAESAFFSHYDPETVEFLASFGK